MEYIQDMVVLRVGTTTGCGYEVKYKAVERKRIED